MYLILNTFGLHMAVQGGRNTYRRAVGSPLTLVTRTLALGQRTLQTQGKKSQTSPSGTQIKKCAERPQSGDLPLHPPVRSVEQETQECQDVVTFSPYGSFIPHQQTFAERYLRKQSLFNSKSELSFWFWSESDFVGLDGTRATTPATQTPN